MCFALGKQSHQSSISGNNLQSQGIQQQGSELRSGNNTRPLNRHGHLSSGYAVRKEFIHRISLIALFALKRSGCAIV
jgi:hypothetical protein